MAISTSRYNDPASSPKSEAKSSDALEKSGRINVASQSTHCNTYRENGGLTESGAMTPWAQSHDQINENATSDPRSGGVDDFSAVSGELESITAYCRDLRPTFYTALGHIVVIQEIPFLMLLGHSHLRDVVSLGRTFFQFAARRWHQGNVAQA